MTTCNQPQNATLVDLLIDGFEKYEMLGGFHMRTLPLPDDAAAARKFGEFFEEARRGKGESLHAEATAERQLVRWARFGEQDAASWCGSKRRASTIGGTSQPLG